MNNKKSVYEFGFVEVEYKCKECKYFRKSWLRHKNLCLSEHLPKILPTDEGGCKKLEFDYSLFRKEAGLDETK